MRVTRANMKIFVTATALGCLSTAAPAMAIEGRYRVEGRITAEKLYPSEAILRRSGEVYGIYSAAIAERARDHALKGKVELRF